ncbi:hypothetical protein UFOVP860_35 [uncultured Caudovirales phage]|uniref:Uncharacterized protein n=1 Tax=uncultured Caudovirales phage TaxID=2100421 RepID=A0A6J5REV8_9CAUD|nr:hypothetical protein UFOVP860_35 [uncultured Caudovirales phage]CAB4196060.1 hypothetical protein UFOVP1293_76 [uncultured Caudovirales phage]CAB4222649.1 hypothetical protein UFOVP1644_94 [uncultured Caudovirales phage]
MTAVQLALVLILASPFWMPALAFALVFAARVMLGAALLLMRATIAVWTALLAVRR